jgi:hypothetical protein
MAIHLVTGSGNTDPESGKKTSSPASCHPHQGFKKFKHFSPFYTYNITPKTVIVKV